MKIAVTGKGGSGKTTLTGTLARVFAREGHRVLAIDGDPNPNLAVTLGIGHKETASISALPRSLLVEQVEPDGTKRRVLNDTAEAIATRHGVTGPEGVTLLVGTQVDHAGAG